MNTMTINGYQAVIAFDPDIQMFRGEFVSLNGGADFYRMSGSHTADNAALIRTLVARGVRARAISMHLVLNDGDVQAANRCPTPRVHIRHPMQRH